MGHHITLLFNEKKIFYDYDIIPQKTNVTNRMYIMAGEWRESSLSVTPLRSGFTRLNFMPPTTHGVSNLISFWQNGCGAIINMYGNGSWAVPNNPHTLSNTVVKVTFEIWQHALPAIGKEQMGKSADYYPEAKPLIALVWKTL